jgi:hypothetical protein
MIQVMKSSKHQLFTSCRSAVYVIQQKQKLRTIDLKLNNTLQYKET